MFPNPSHTRDPSGDYNAAATALGVTPRSRCILVESPDFGATAGSCSPHPDLDAGEVECEYNAGTWDSSNEVLLVDSCTGALRSSMMTQPFWREEPIFWPTAVELTVRGNRSIYQDRLGMNRTNPAFQAKRREEKRREVVFDSQVSTTPPAVCSPAP
eukprot:COSAG06_NODE_4988_length_3804_cov_2162.275574_3_plen_157_part_00